MKRVRRAISLVELACLRYTASRRRPSEEGSVYTRCGRHAGRALRWRHQEEPLMESNRRAGRRSRHLAPSMESDFIGLDDPRHGADDHTPDGLIRDLPVLPVRNTVLLPHMVAPLFIDREPALKAVEAA